MFWILGKVRPSAKHCGVMESAQATAAVYSILSVMRTMPPTDAAETIEGVTHKICIISARYAIRTKEN